MFFNIATLVLPLMFLGGITTATPLETRAVKATEAPGVDVSKLEIPVPISPTIAPGSEHTDLEKGATLPGGSTTSPNSAFHTLGGTAADQFVVCPLANCSGSCVGYTLSSLRKNVCYSTTFYSSYYISRASNHGLSYSMYAAEASCFSPVVVPSVNACYQSYGPDGTLRTFQTFYRN